MNRRHSIALSGVLGLALAVTAPILAQDNNSSASARQNADAEANHVYKVGGDVSAPVLIHSVEQEGHEVDADVSGTVLVNLRVDVNGNPTHIHVTRGLSMGLDEKAFMAVRQYKFKPAMKDGKPVMVELNVEVKFRKSTN